MTDPDDSATLGPRFERALTYAAQLHAGQIRKGANVPYVSHLLGVCSLVIENGGSEEQAIAALLHDALEDQADRTSAAELERLFGAEVARIVRGCSDSTGEPKPPWRERKERYLEHLQEADEDVLFVSCADKLHNARAILTDQRELGNDFFERFTASGPDDQLWYYRGLSEVLARRLPGRLSDELRRVIDQLEASVHSDARTG